MKREYTTHTHLAFRSSFRLCSQTDVNVSVAAAVDVVIIRLVPNESEEHNSVYQFGSVSCIKERNNGNATAATTQGKRKMFSFITACHRGKMENCKNPNCHTNNCAPISQKLTGTKWKVRFCVNSDPKLQQLMLYQALKIIATSASASASAAASVAAYVLLHCIASVIVPSTAPRQSNPPLPPTWEFAHWMIHIFLL